MTNREKGWTILAILTILVITLLVITIGIYPTLFVIIMLSILAAIVGISTYAITLIIENRE